MNTTTENSHDTSNDTDHDTSTETAQNAGQMPIETPEASQEQAPIHPTYPDFTFDQLAPKLAAAVAGAGWKSPMPVQTRVIPVLLDGKDVIVQSRTGSGKTGAFLLPLLEMVDPSRKETQAMVLLPTRELAQQVKNECDRISGDPSMCVAIYGGTGYKPQLDALKNGVPIVAATPGRLLDHLNRGSLNCRNLEFLILDEADEMLSMGFFPDMLRIKTFLPVNRLSAMFSATMPESVQKLAREFLYEPLFIGLSADAISVPQMEHHYYVSEDIWKDRALMKVIEAENPPNGIIFCNTKEAVSYLVTLLQRYGYDVEPLSGDLSQKERDRVMTKLRRYQLRFLIATDVAARGIDISHLEYVFIYDWPKDFEQYIHRAGRTGRAGKSGIAVSFVNVMEEMDLKRAAKRHGIEFQGKKALEDLPLQAKIADRLITRLEAERRDLDKTRMERLNRFAQVIPALRDHEQYPQLLAILLDRYHQQIVKEALVPPGAGEDAPPPVAEEEADYLPSRPPREPRDAHGPRRDSRGGGGPRRGGRGGPPRRR